MQYGIVLTTGDAGDVAELAVLAEEAGWDAIFGWEPVWGVDAWVALTAAAMRTTRIKLGTMLTPLPRRKPWDLASTTATLDRLSGGRVILSVGMGALHDNWLAFERDQGRKTRAELLDEGLDVLFGLWAGQPFGYEGRHYRVTPTRHMVPDPPVQVPRITTWCVGVNGALRSMSRAARCDGLLPNITTADGQFDFNPPLAGWLDSAREIHSLRVELGRTGPYDVVYETTTDWKDLDATREKIETLHDGSYTWYLDSDWHTEHDDPLAALRARVESGPPR
ncbi:LLM class flavin-dependent oxidoreductase [Mycobacteroides chelonae]|uniref:LLM class flavin-dependent oxidoreductase n=1 Tax=Mycobacteroides chelonae TaxID=1774 RepID=UPI0004AA7456|nr:LLM class flavin-dependent oxidoreductase [Mycobacteroides chelonae]MBF9316122.1 LLM class flavin-dependent oxidoreductase [Mycobacteroides chelonae]OHT69680.1 monooxygenase [Mycobacteroides chelonae]OHT72010.1 monooxygenase [Mycobacteroides chelonae]OHT84839.1 monooxygenase [Mycobacteroides chelonae]